MTRRDRWARLTPYEVGLPGREFADRVFAGIREEAEARDLDLTDPGAFILLGEVGRAIREIQGEERGGEALHRFAAFLFHGFHFHRAGETLLLLEEEAARHLTGDGFRSTTWEGEVPSPAGYLQLPRHLFWSDPGAEGTPEPLDGVFWTRASRETLALLVALGVREGRPGLSLMELPPVPLAETRAWLARGVRDDGRDFATTLPGGDLDRLYSVTTLGEALKLAARALAYLARTPEALGPEERAPRPEAAASHGEPTDAAPADAGAARPSLLPFRRIRLVEEAGES